MNILHEDEHIIVCEKPVGVPSQSDKTSDMDMVNLLKNKIYENIGATNPYVGIVHRLDRPVGGIMVFAKSELASKNLSEQIRKREMKKLYLAVLTGDIEDEGNLTDYLIKDGKSNFTKVTTAKNKNAKKAELTYKIKSKSTTKLKDKEIYINLAEINLITGRHHQIRVQMANQGAGIWGDTKYNSIFTNVKEWTEIGLYAYKLEFTHPKSKKKLTFELLPNKGIFKCFNYL